MEEQSSLYSFFNKYNRLQNQNNPSDTVDLQLNPKCKSRIGLFFSFLALSASFELLLASSIGKSAFPNDNAISSFLTNPLSNNHEHFTNGTIAGMMGFILSLVVLIYFSKKLWNPKNLQHPQHYSTTFTDSGLFEFNGNPLYKVQNFYKAYDIEHQSHTLAAFIAHENTPIYIGIPSESYEANVICSEFFDKEIERLQTKGTLPKGCGYDRFVKVPIQLCINLNERQVIDLNTNMT